jgi:hypothetical protein
MNIYIIMGNILSDSNDREEDLDELEELEETEKKSKKTKANSHDSSSQDPSSKVKTRRRRGQNIRTKSKANRRY